MKLVARNRTASSYSNTCCSPEKGIDSWAHGHAGQGRSKTLTEATEFPHQAEPRGLKLKEQDMFPRHLFLLGFRVLIFALMI